MSALDMEAEARRAVEICRVIPELEISTVGNVVRIQAADEDEDLLEWSAAIMDKEDAFRIPEEAKAFVDMRTGYPALAQAYLDERKKVVGMSTKAVADDDYIKRISHDLHHANTVEIPTYLAERDAARREVDDLKARLAVAKRNLDTCAEQRDALRARLAECEPVVEAVRQLAQCSCRGLPYKCQKVCALLAIKLPTKADQ